MRLRLLDLKLLSYPDEPGFFPRWLHSRKNLYGYVFEGECYDIGTPQSYREVNDIFAEVVANEV